jgi:hypothetical protein
MSEEKQPKKFDQTGPRFAKGKVYKVTSPKTDKIYIGSTISALSKRMGQHRERYRYYVAGEFNDLSVFRVLEVDPGAKIELIEAYPCNSSNELRQRERHHIIENRAQCVNIQLPARTQREYYADNKKRIQAKRAADLCVCTCGRQIGRVNHARHMNTPLHARRMACIV